MRHSARIVTYLLRLLAMLVASVALTAWPSPATAPAQAWTTHVGIGDNFFAPARIHVPVGETVVWTNDGRHHHTVTSVVGRFDSGVLGPGGRFALTFAHPGTYYYYCRIHPREMRGVVVVGRGAAAYSYRSCAPYYGYPGYGPGSC